MSFNIMALTDVPCALTKSCRLRGLTARGAVLKIDAPWNKGLPPSWRRSLFRIAMDGK